MEYPDLEIGEFNRKGGYYPVRTRLSGGCQETVLGSRFGSKIYFERQADFQLAPDDFGGWRVVNLYTNSVPLCEVRVRHIRISAGANRSMPEALKVARVARERIAAGEDFEKVAEELSEDPGSAKHGGDLGFVRRGGRFAGDLQGFEDAIFSASLGEVTGPVITPFGADLFEVTARRPARAR